MFFTYFVAQNGLGRLLAAKLLTGGVVLVLIGVVVLVFPLLVASVVAAGCFVVASFLLGGAWRVYRASRLLPPREPAREQFEDAAWREIR